MGVDEGGSEKRGRGRKEWLMMMIREEEKRDGEGGDERKKVLMREEWRGDEGKGERLAES